MPDDQTLATILAVCNLLGPNPPAVQDVINVYERAMNEVLCYRRSTRQTELGGIPKMEEISR